MFREGSLAKEMLKRITVSRSLAFVPNEFFDLSDRDQVGRVLRKLVKQGVLTKLGYGVYAKTRRSKLSDNLIIEGGLIDASKEALKKLGINVMPTSLQNAYNANLTTQVPTGLLIGVNKRISRKISYNGITIKYEQITKR